MPRPKLAAQAGQGGLTGMVEIACVNKAPKYLKKKEFEKLTAVLQKCFDTYFLPVWGYPVKLYNRVPKPSDWQFIYFNTAEDADDLGYHDLTKDGQPISKVFVKTTLDAKEIVSVTACHELFEMAIDPVANLWAEAEDGTEYAYEMCDAVEDATFTVDGIKMSNFLHPAWFEPFQHPAGTKFDHLGLLKKPFTMTKGGYVITKVNGKVDEHYGSDAKRKEFARENRLGHRSEYRKPKGVGFRLG